MPDMRDAAAGIITARPDIRPRSRPVCLLGFHPCMAAVRLPYSIQRPADNDSLLRSTMAAIQKINLIS